jgi:hypothetical protein
VPSDITASTHSLDHEFLIAARQAQDITARQKLINLTTAFDSLTGLVSALCWSAQWRQPVSAPIQALMFSVRLFAGSLANARQRFL